MWCCSISPDHNPAIQVNAPVLCLANCYAGADFAGDRPAKASWLSLSERIQWQ